MAYITRFNAMRIVANNDMKAINTDDQEVYKMPIYFFNSLERGKILGMKCLLENPDNFAQHYKRIQSKDSLNFVFEGGSPAYHSSPACRRLKSDFINFRLPPEIKTKGKEAISEFRTWFKQNVHLLSKPDLFVARVRMKYGITVEEVIRENSGYEELENLDLRQLEAKVEGIIRDAGGFFKRQDAEHQELLRKYQKLTFLAYKDSPIEKSKSPIINEHLKEFLKLYDAQFKKPLIELLLHYYRVKLNPSLVFEGKLLERIGFNACPECHGNKPDEPV